MRVNRDDIVDRVLAAVEIPALGLWFGALVAFAAFFAPGAFRAVAPLDLGRFANLIAGQLEALAILGFVCGGLAFGLAIIRSRTAGDRRWDLGRATLVLVAVGTVAYHRATVLPLMTATVDVRSPAYHALHTRSTTIYGVVVVCVFGALILAALQPGSER